LEAELCVWVRQILEVTFSRGYRISGWVAKDNVLKFGRKETGGNTTPAASVMHSLKLATVRRVMFVYGIKERRRV
jgi:hypothetical protein